MSYSYRDRSNEEPVEEEDVLHYFMSSLHHMDPFQGYYSPIMDASGDPIHYVSPQLYPPGYRYAHRYDEGILAFETFATHQFRGLLMVGPQVEHCVRNLLEEGVSVTSVEMVWGRGCGGWTIGHWKLENVQWYARKRMHADGSWETEDEYNARIAHVCEAAGVF
jgi:hypothetical protein